MLLAVMGVSGSGKTTLASTLAERLGWIFQDADDFHTPDNIAWMRAGIPLTDAGRLPWLDKIADWARAMEADGNNAVLACSFLRRAYRLRVLSQVRQSRLIELHADAATIRERLRHRQGHFMPASLLDSQFAALEEPGADENPLRIDAGGNAQAALAEALRLLALQGIFPEQR